MLQQPTTSNVIRFGILTLPLGGLLTLVGLLGRYYTPNPYFDPKLAAWAASSTDYFISQFVGNVLGLMLLIFGLIALTAYLANTRVRGWALTGMVLGIAGLALVMSALGVTTFALPAIGQAYLNGQQDALTIVEAIFSGPAREIFIPVFVLYVAGFILFGVAIWRSGVLPKPAAISWGLHAPFVSTFVRPQPTLLTIVGALLFILGGGIIAFSVFRRPSAGEAKAEADRPQGDPKK